MKPQTLQNSQARSSIGTIQSSLPYSLSVEEFTTPNPVTATEQTTLADLELLMKENEIRHLPIERDQRIVGIVSDRDLRMVASFNFKEKEVLQAKDIMTEEPVTVSCNARLDEVALSMSAKKIGSVMVNDENGRFLGIFTATDALNALIEITRSLTEEKS